MSKSSGGVDVVVDHLDDEGSPNCPHGPMLLFERYTGQSVRRFYACSACRDRKHCPFFQWADQPLSKEKAKARKKLVRELQKSKMSHSQHKKRLSDLRRLSLKERAVCQSCGCLLLGTEVKGHEGHSVVPELTDYQLRRPTTLLPALDHNKSNAQYLFSNKTTDFIIETMENLKFSKVLCVGVPRVHEEICARTRAKKTSLRSLLLDIDQRLEQFFTRKQFCQYNMFNNYFFRGPKAREVYTDYLAETDGSLVVIMDPPFGGMVDILSHSVKKISADWTAVNKKNPDTRLPFLWVFPYFMESRVRSSCPDFTMLDFKVEYDNHAVYCQKAKPNVRGSPVRIFTNLPPEGIPLPAESHRYCKRCQRYVFKETVHCEECDSCNSQDGRQYRHCVPCGRCVKPSWLHCDKCKACHLPDYQCQDPKTGCHICGDEGHKRRECPQRFSRKRKQSPDNPKGHTRRKKHKIS